MHVTVKEVEKKERKEKRERKEPRPHRIQQRTVINYESEKDKLTCL